MSIKVTRFDHPFETKPTVTDVPKGKTYRQIIGDRKNVLLFNNDMRIPEEQYDNEIPDNSFTLIRDIPTGTPQQAVFHMIGVGEMFAGTVAEIFGLIPALFGNTDLLAGGAAMVREGTGFFITGGPAAKSDGSGGQNPPSLRGGSNQINKYGAIPVILGTHFITPFFAGSPYTELATTTTPGDTQYIHTALIIGYGPLALSEIRIGENLLSAGIAAGASGALTLLGQFAGTQIPTNVEVQSMNHTAMTYYPVKVVEQQFNIEVRRPTGSAVGDVYLQQTTAPSTTRIEVEIAFSAGLSVPSVEIMVQYKIYNTDNAWSAPILLSNPTISDQSKILTRYSYGVTPATPGQFDVRIYKVTEDTVDSSKVDKVFWTTLRSITADKPISDAIRDKVVVMSLKMKATAGMSQSLDTINMVASNVIPKYSGSGSGTSQWLTTGNSSNPASLALYMLRGAPNAFPEVDANIDWPAFESFYNWCDSHTVSPGTASSDCNAVLDSQESLYSTLSKILSVGRAQLDKRGNVFTLIHDIGGKTPVALITPRNSYNFNGNKPFPIVPHGLKVTFVNAAKGYQKDEIVVLWNDSSVSYLYNYSVGGVVALRDAWGTVRTVTGIYTLATQLESIERWGITSQAEAFREGRYLLARQYLQLETYTVQQDFQSIAYRRGDVVKFGHDTPLLGVIGGRVKSVTVDGSSNVVTATFDEPVTMVSGNYGIRYQRSLDGAVYFASVALSVGTSNTVTFSTVIPAATKPYVDDLFWFGQATNANSNTEAVDCLVVGIEPSEDLSATIYLQEYNSAIYTADGSGVVSPSYDSKVTNRTAASFPQRFSENQTAAIATTTATVAAQAFADATTYTFTQPTAPTFGLRPLAAKGDTWINSTTGSISVATDNGSGVSWALNNGILTKTVPDTGLNVNSLGIGYYVSGVWKTKLAPNGDFLFSGPSGDLLWDSDNGVLGIGTGAFGTSGRKFYVDSAGRFSLKDKLTWDGTTLTINGGGTFSGALSAASGSFSGALSGGTISIGSVNNIFKADSNGIYLGNATFGSAPFRVTPAGVLSASSGTIGNWILNSNSLDSASAGNAMIRLDQTNMRVSVLDNTAIVKTAMGYLGGLKKNGAPYNPTKSYVVGEYVNVGGTIYKSTSTGLLASPPSAGWATSSDTWTSNDYGFYLGIGNNAVCDGSLTVLNGDMIARDASFKITSGTSEWLRLGTYNGAYGLFNYQGQSTPYSSITFSTGTVNVNGYLNVNSPMVYGDGAVIYFYNAARTVNTGSFIMGPSGTTNGGDAVINCASMGITGKLTTSGQIYTLDSFVGAGTYLTGTASMLTAAAITGQANSATITCSSSVVASNIVQRDANGYIYGNYIQSTDDVSAGTITYIMAKFGDNWYRSATAAKIAIFLSGSTMNIAGSSTSCSGNAASATTATNLSGGYVTATSLNVGGYSGISSGGSDTPTTGSAACGRWVKFYDGTMICWIRNKPADGANMVTTWTYPAVFYAPPTINGTKWSSSSYGPLLINSTTPPTTSVAVLDSSGGQTTKMSIDIMAIGRWY